MSVHRYKDEVSSKVSQERIIREYIEFSKKILAWIPAVVIKFKELKKFF